MTSDRTPPRRRILKSTAKASTGQTSKPFGPFQSFEDCVDEFEGDPNVDDPEALCAEMERNPDQFFGGLQAADSMLQNLKVTFVSGVDMPAQDSEFVLMKSVEDIDAALDTSDWSRRERPLLVHKQGDDTAEQKTWAPVLIPDEVDKQGDLVPFKEIERAAHEFLKQFRNVDTDHSLLSGKGQPIESWTLKNAQTFTKPDSTESREYPKGTWMLGVEWSDDAWTRIEEGDLTGLSIFGEAEALNIDAIAEAANGNGSAMSMDLSLGKARLTPCEYRAIKQIAEETHQAISALVDEFLQDTDSDPTVSDLLEWVDTMDRQEEDAAIQLAGAVEDFQEETDADLGSVLINDFLRWLSDQLTDGQTEPQEASVERRALASAATKLEKSVAGTDADIRLMTVRAKKMDRLTADLT